MAQAQCGCRPRLTHEITDRVMNSFRGLEIGAGGAMVVAKQLYQAHELVRPSMKRPLAVLAAEGGGILQRTSRVRHVAAQKGEDAGRHAQPRPVSARRRAPLEEGAGQPAAVALSV